LTAEINLIVEGLDSKAVLVLSGITEVEYPELGESLRRLIVHQALGVLELVHSESNYRIQKIESRCMRKGKISGVCLWRDLM
jgi:hypothetical protein